MSTPVLSRVAFKTVEVPRPSGETQEVQLYNSRLSYSSRMTPGGDIKKLATVFTIPSSQFYYLTSQGNPVPYLATVATGSAENQFGKDVSAWRNALPGNDRLYARQPGQASSGNAEVDTFSIVTGTPLKYFRVNADYANQMRDALRSQGEFGPLDVNLNFVQRLIAYPVHPDADFFAASQLATLPPTDDALTFIQEYLDDRGIVTFTADNILGLDPADKFFYLTRFYGPPVEGNLENLALSRELNQLARNDTTRALARKAVERIEQYRLLEGYFKAYFDEFNRNPDSIEYQNLGASTLTRFLSDPFAYLALIDRPENLPTPLTLNTIRQIPVHNQQNLTDVLKNYTDFEIESLVGNVEADNRTNFLRLAVERLIQSQVFLLFPQEAEVCRNKSSTIEGIDFGEVETLYLGIGQLSAGLSCYEIEGDLIENFDANTDSEGVITFKDVLDYNHNFSLAQIEAIHKVLQIGRSGVDVPPEWIERFARFAVDYRNQSSASFQLVRQLRNFVNQSPENKDLIRDIFMTYFRTGMYMRQWKGPGNPYPLSTGSTGLEAATGTEAANIIEVNVSSTRGDFLQAMNRLPEGIRGVIWQLPLYTNANGRIEITNDTIRSLDQRVEAGYTIGTSSCIRMASGPWSFSGAYYVKQVVGEDIPGYDLSQTIAFIY